MPPVSAGILVYRRLEGRLEVLLGRLGGPLWTRREHWTIPKGLVEAGETPIDAAYREFEEETGWAAPHGDPYELGEIRQASGKRVHAWALEGDYDPADLVPGTFRMEWPPRSGRFGDFPELSEVRWFAIEVARATINRSQTPLLDRLEAALSVE